MPAREVNRDRHRRYWDKESASYDRQMQFFERLLAPDSREWVCSRALGDTLEVGIGTGLNLEFYPRGVTLTGVDFSTGMLDVARRRAGGLGRDVVLRTADALELPFPDASFDTVVATYVMCAVPDERRVLNEMNRVLRPGGQMLLVDHVAGGAWPVRVIQRVAEVFTVPLQGEHFLRRPLGLVKAVGLQIEQRERFKLGLIERLAARKPAAS